MSARKNFKIQSSTSGEKSSAANQYMDLVLGQRKLWALFKFEIITGVGNLLPGAAGLLFRQKLFPMLLGACGRGVVFGQHVTLRHPHKIRLGDNVIIDDNVMLDAKGAENKGIDIASEAYIGRNSIISCKEGDISIGERANIGFNCEVVAASSRVDIGSDGIIAAYCYLIGGGSYHIDNIDRPMAQCYDYEGKGGIVVGDNVWLGARVTVQDGGHIADGCVISAASVVTKPLPENSICRGIPAKVVRQREGCE